MERWVLAVARGAARGKRFEFAAGAVRIGRTSDNECVLEDEGVSRRHARLVSLDGECVIEDLSSVNGVRVNGARVRNSRRLGEGDRITLGRALVVFLRPQTDEAGALVSTRVYRRPDLRHDPEVEPEGPFSVPEGLADDVERTPAVEPLADDGRDFVIDIDLGEPFSVLPDGVNQTIPEGIGRTQRRAEAASFSAPTRVPVAMTAVRTAREENSAKRELGTREGASFSVPARPPVAVAALEDNAAALELPARQATSFSAPTPLPVAMAAARAALEDSFAARGHASWEGPEWVDRDARCPLVPGALTSGASMAASIASGAAPIERPIARHAQAIAVGALMPGRRRNAASSDGLHRALGRTGAASLQRNGSRSSSRQPLLVSHDKPLANLPFPSAALLAFQNAEAWKESTSLEARSSADLSPDVATDAGASRFGLDAVASRSRWRRFFGRTPSSRRSLLKVGGLVLTTVLGVLASGWWLAPDRAFETQEPLRLRSTPIEGPLTTTEGFDFNFEFASATRFAAMLHLRSEGFAPGSVVVVLNGQVVEDLPLSPLDIDAFDAVSVALPSKWIRVGESNRLRIERKKTAPSSGPWTLRDVRVEPLALPALTRTEALARATEVLHRAEELERQSLLGNDHAHRAWKLYREAGLVLEPLDPDPPLRFEARAGERRVRAGLDRMCADLRFRIHRALQLSETDAARRASGELSRSFPEPGHPCHDEARQWVDSLALP